MAINDAAALEKKLRFRALRIDEAANDVVKKVSLLIDQTVVFATPVDTGRARSNWIVSTGFPVETPIEPYVPGDKLGLNEAANANAAIARGADVIQRRTRGQTIFITNNVDYIGKLNRGSSRQAPKNFVRIAFKAAVNAIRVTKFEI